MKKLGSFHFDVELGEEISLLISFIDMAHMPMVSLDGIPIEPHGKYANVAGYTFRATKPVGQSHHCMVHLPDATFPNAEYNIELFGSGESIEHQLVKPTGPQSIGNLIYTFSTHGSGGGGRE
jgi:hypothetical protein